MPIKRQPKKTKLVSVKTPKPVKEKTTPKQSQQDEKTEYNAEDDIDAITEIGTEYNEQDTLTELPEDNYRETYEYIPQVRHEITYLTADNRKTSEVMTKFEYAEIISQRAVQIENGGVCYADNTDDISDPIQLAKKELIDKRCPLNIVRMLTDKVGEVWSANELAINY